jgi:hypothetical protein
MSTSNPNEYSAPFPYRPFHGRREIRLIRFLPGTTPTCQMITVEVEKAPPYIALSYTWGSKYVERKLNVDGHEISISKNLAEAIDATFVIAREASLMFWADSICINQADIHERSRQVQLMGTIYRSAELVYVWLGLAENDSDFAFDEIKNWKSRFDELKLQNGGSDELAVTSIASDDPYFFQCPSTTRAEGTWDDLSSTLVEKNMDSTGGNNDKSFKNNVVLWRPDDKLGVLSGSTTNHSPCDTLCKGGNERGFESWHGTST